jgi:hypothetical protein
MKQLRAGETVGMPGTVRSRIQRLTVGYIKMNTIYRVTVCCFVWVWKSISYVKERDWLRVFENRVLRNMFGTEKEEVTGDWTRLHNEELHDFCSSRAFFT